MLDKKILKREEVTITPQIVALFDEAKKHTLVQLQWEGELYHLIYSGKIKEDD